MSQNLKNIEGNSTKFTWENIGVVPPREAYLAACKTSVKHLIKEMLYW